MSAEQPTRGNQPIFAKSASPSDRARQIQELTNHYLELVKAGAPSQDLKLAERALTEALGPDRFNFARQVPNYLRSLTAAGTNALQSFRLPSGELIQDRRAETASLLKENIRTSDRDEGNYSLKAGRLVEESKKYGGYFGDRSSTLAVAEREVAQKLQGLYSAFEQAILKRFVRGETLAQKSTDGKLHYLVKTARQHCQFFARLASRTVRRIAKTNDLEQLFFRGLVAKGDRGVVIADLALKSQMAKFARLGIFAQALARFQTLNLKPGDAFGKDALGFTGEEFGYLALAAATDAKYTTVPKAAAGKFISARAEALAASELGLPLSSSLGGKTPRSKKLSGRPTILGRLSSRDSEPEEIPSQFVPWWHWGRLSYPPKFKWTTVFFYLALLVIALIGIGLTTYKFFSY